MKAQHRPWLKNTHCAPDHVKSIKHFFLKCLLLQTAITLCISPKQNKTKQNFKVDPSWIIKNLP